MHGNENTRTEREEMNKNEMREDEQEKEKENNNQDGTISACFNAHFFKVSIFLSHKEAKGILLV